MSPEMWASLRKQVEAELAAISEEYAEKTWRAMVEWAENDQPVYILDVPDVCEAAEPALALALLLKGIEIESYYGSMTVVP